MAIEFLKFLGEVQTTSLSHVKMYVCLVKKIPYSSFLFVKMRNSCLHDIITKLMNLNAAK
jgi:hypothetical protein